MSENGNSAKGKCFHLSIQCSHIFTFQVAALEVNLQDTGWSVRMFSKTFRYLPVQMVNCQCVSEILKEFSMKPVTACLCMCICLGT